MSSLHDRATTDGPSFLALTGPLTFLDVEVVNDRIVELCVWRMVLGESAAPFTSLVDPGMRVWAPAAKRRAAVERSVHGITSAMVRGKPRLLDLVPIIRHLCAGTTVVSHKASYERRIITLEFERLGQEWDYPQLCTFKLAQRLYPGRRGGRGYSLGSLAADLQVPYVAQHRAAGDVCAMVLVLWRMLEGHRARSDIADAIAASRIAAPRAEPEL